MDQSVAPRRFVYTPELAYLIIEAYTNGSSLSEIAEREDMPRLSTINRWLHKEASFRKDFEEARALKALQYEQVVDSVMQESSQLEKEEVPGYRLKFDTASWLAEKHDPSRFGKKTTISGDQSNPIQIVVSTGVPAPTMEQEPPELDSSGMILAKTVESIVVDEVEHGHGD